jgi:hypothetical protein
MKFKVAIQPTIASTDIAMIIWCETGRILHDEKLNVDYEESFNTACIWPKELDEQASVLTLALNSLMAYVNKEIDHGRQQSPIL